MQREAILNYILAGDCITFADHKYDSLCGIVSKNKIYATHTEAILCTNQEEPCLRTLETMIMVLKPLDNDNIIARNIWFSR